MGAGAFVEPLVVVTLLFGGTWINRNTGNTSRPNRWHSRKSSTTFRDGSLDSMESGAFSPTSKSGLIAHRPLSPSLLDESDWRKREIRVLGWKKEVTTPNTAVFRNRLLSRLLQKLPFLVECWYWALVYWVSNFRWDTVVYGRADFA